MIEVIMPVLFTDPAWQVPMTKFALELLFTDPGVDAAMKITVVETGSNYLAPPDQELDGFAYAWAPCDGHWQSLGIEYEHIHFPTRRSYSQDFNDALRESTADLIVHTGNDVFVRPGWAAAMLEPFNKYADCGVSCLASSDLSAGPAGQRGDFVCEGVYGPHMMFRRANGVGTQMLLDEDFPDIFSDTELILRHYAAGLRSYRNHAIVIDHLNRATYNDQHSGEEQRERFMKYRQQMAAKHYASAGHMLMYHHLVNGDVV